MNNHNLYRISNFAEKNKSFSDFNIVNKFKLNFNKYKTNSKIQIGGVGEIPEDSQQQTTGKSETNQLQTTDKSETNQLQTTDKSETNQLQTTDKSETNQQQTTNKPETIQQQTNGNQETNQQQTTNKPETIQQQTTDKSEANQQQTNGNPEAIQQQTNSKPEANQQQSNGNPVPSKENIALDTPTSKNVDKIGRMNDSNLVRPDFISDEIKTYTIEKGTILFFSTVDKRGFNTNTIQLRSTDSKSIILFFTPNFRLASDKIQGCSIDKQKGYIHVFRVKQEIPNIFIKLPYDTDDDIGLDNLFNKFCAGSNTYNGVGFFYPKNEIETFNNIQTGGAISDNNYYSEFGLCNPGPFLEYLYTQKCMSLRKLSEPYRFDN